MVIVEVREASLHASYLSVDGAAVLFLPCCTTPFCGSNCVSNEPIFSLRPQMCGMQWTVINEKEKVHVLLWWESARVIDWIKFAVLGTANSYTCRSLGMFAPIRVETVTVLINARGQLLFQCTTEKPDLDPTSLSLSLSKALPMVSWWSCLWFMWPGSCIICFCRCLQTLQMQTFSAIHWRPPLSFIFRHYLEVITRRN